MSQKINFTKHIIAASLLIFSAVAFVSCDKYSWDPPKFDPNTPVSFKNDIIPILSTAYGPENKSCKDCHYSGNLDFTPINAYETMGNYIDVNNPESSEIINKLYDSHDGRCSEINKQKILAWIKQGALENDNN